MNPSNEDISKRAYQLWHEYGSPDGRDTEIWLTAERQLKAKAQNETAAQGNSSQTAPAKGASAKFTERVKSETAAESMVEHHISPPIPDQAAINAALQKKSARAPQTPSHTAPPAKPAETGKPIWDKPHSS